MSAPKPAPKGEREPLAEAEATVEREMVREVARLIAEFRNELKRQGIEKFEARDLTDTFSQHMLERHLPLPHEEHNDNDFA